MSPFFLKVTLFLASDSSLVTIMKKLFPKPIIIVLLLVFVSTTCYSEINIPFNDNWKFRLEDSADYATPDYDDTAWRLIDVPHDWSIEGKYDKNNPSGPQGGYMPCGIAWYRKSFILPDSLQNKRIYIRFDGVYMKSQVWINGRMVGEYPNGYNAFQYDITPFVNRGNARNVVAVKVDNSLQPASRWYTGSGIYRDVSIIATSQQHFAHDGIFVTTPEVTKERASVAIKAHVICNAWPETRFNWTDNTDLYVWTRNLGSKNSNGGNRRISKDCTIEFTLRAQDGTIVGRNAIAKNMGDFTEYDIESSITVDKPSLWSPNSPALYNLTCRLLCGDELLDSKTFSIGIRSIEFSNKGMKTNGKVDKLKGVCLHQNVGPFGAAVPRDVWLQRLKTLKEMGCNAIRMSHYPFPSYMYSLCDSLGFYVSNEIFDEWNRGQEWGYSESSYGKMPYTYHLYFDQWAETDLVRMIRRDRNHPCVVLYVLGNEIPNQRINGNDIAKKLVAISHREDPTRPVTAACDFFAGANIYGFMDNFDIAGYNYIDRIHRDSLYAQEQKIYPERTLLGTETYHAAGNPIWAKKTDSCIGEFIWVGFDYLGEIVWDGNRGWEESMNDIAGFPKPEHYLRKAYWSAEPVVHAGVEFPNPHPDFPWTPRRVEDHWNWNADTTLNVIVYSNCDEIELRLNGKKIGRGKVSADSCLINFSNIKYKPGNLEAIAFKNSRIVSRHKLTTAGSPFRIEAINAKGNNVDYIELRVVDRKGNLVPTFNGIVSLKSDNCEIIGIDNGNQYDPEGLKYTSVTRGSFFKGKMRLYVRHKEPHVGKYSVYSDIIGNFTFNL